MIGDEPKPYGPVPFHHPSRPKLANELPCWLGTSIALPSVDLRPEEGSELGAQSPRWTVLILVGDLGGSSWAIRELTEIETFDLLRDWARGPEEALQRWFGREAPKGGPHEATLEEVFEARATAGGKTAEDLGL